MIDTRKYEGHTPAPWMNLGSDANSLLMQDAPLLLAEVKRLREVAYRKDMQVGERDREIKRLREDNRKLHDAINGCAYTNKQGSAHDLYCESMVERCPVCDENVESGLCDEECEQE